MPPLRREAWFALLVLAFVGSGSALILATNGCGGSGWAAADTTSLTTSVRSQVRIEQICASDATCVASQVRALSRSALCDDSSVLVRHGQPTPDAGVTCRVQ